MNIIDFPTKNDMRLQFVNEVMRQYWVQSILNNSRNTRSARRKTILRKVSQWLRFRTTR